VVSSSLTIFVNAMRKTRLSLYYLVTYLTLTGLGLMFAPSAVLTLLMATHTYDDAMPRFVGILMLAIAMIVSQIIRFKVEQLYPITVPVRLVIWVYVLWLYFRSGDTFFAMVLAVVGLGIVLTGVTYLIERSTKQA
jgi:uncharacterized protein YjeT (DUF2065 family)